MFYLFLAVIFLFFIDLFCKYRDKLYFKNDIIKSYKNGENYDNIDIDYVKDYYLSLDIKNGIDDTTWNDLNFDSVYKRISNLQSYIGINVLYKLLRTPTKSLSELSSRESIITYFSSNLEQRIKVQYILRRLLGRNQKIYIHKHLNSPKTDTKKLIVFKVLRYSFIITIACLFWIKGFIFLALFIIELLAILVLNMYFYKEIEVNQYLHIINLIKCAKSINKMNIPIIKSRYDKLDNYLLKFKNIERKTLNSSLDVSFDIVSIIVKLIKILFLIDIIDDEEIHLAVATYNQEFSYIYNFVGELDSLISVGFFRNSLSYYSNPNYVDDSTLSFTDIYNPLIKNSVTNSLEVKSPILITGSNASGKSTFLRSIGINILLGQTINTVCAKDFKSKLCSLSTSMSINDDLLAGDSFYTAEVKAIKRMMDSLNTNDFSIFIIDELLKGTNTLERIAGGSSILEFLAPKNCICFAATHDLELTSILEGTFKNYNFDGNLKDGNIVFDYKIKDGVSTKRNAISLLENFNYDKSIISTTNKRLEFFNKNKTWN